MASSVIIRPAMLSDCEALASMWADMARQHAGYHDDRWGFMPDAPDKWRQYVRATHESPEHVRLVADDVGGNGQPPAGLVAFACGELHETPPVFRVCLRGAISDLYVRPSHRRRGIGMRLMKQAVDVLRTRGAEDVCLRVAAGNEAALAFYRKLQMQTVTYELYMKL